MRTRSKGLTGLIAVAAASLLTLTACGGGSESNKETPTSNAGFADCEKSPNTCNSGNTKPGGEYIFGLEQSFTSWNINTEEGNTLVASQALSGVLPQVFRSDPSGTLQQDERRQRLVVRRVLAEMLFEGICAHCGLACFLLT